MLQTTDSWFLRWWPLSLLAIALILVGLVATRNFEPHDDAYITFHYAQHLAQGEGAVFNRGERVEGYSTPSFMLLVALGVVLGASPASVAAVLNGIALAFLLFIGWIWSAELSGQRVLRGETEKATRPRRVFAVAGLVTSSVLLLHPGTLYYLASGMETLFFCALVAGAVFLLRAPVQSVGQAALLAAVLATASITRPEAVGVVGVLVVLVLIDALTGKTRWGKALLIGGIVGAALAALASARWAYFGELAPNTYYAKVGPWDARRVTRGIEYVLQAAPWIAPPLLLLPLAVRRLSRSLTLLLFPLAFFLAFSLYAGGDWMFGQRMLLPGLVTAAVLGGLVASQVAATIAERSLPLRLASLGALVLLLSACSLLQLHAMRLARSNAEVITTFRLLGERLGQTPEGTSLAIGAVGAVGYGSDRTIIDAFGLIDREIARLGDWDAASATGHQRSSGLAVWERRPNFIVPTNSTSTEPLPENELLRRLQGDPSRFWVGRVRSQPGFDREYVYRSVGFENGNYVGLYQRRSNPAALDLGRTLERKNLGKHQDGKLPR